MKFIYASIMLCLLVCTLRNPGIILSEELQIQDERQNPLLLAATASHLLPLLRNTNYTNAPSILIFGDNCSYTEVTTLLTINSLDSGKNISDAFLSVFLSLLNISTYTISLKDLTVLNIDLGTIREIEGDTLLTIKSILETTYNSIIISLFSFKEGVESITGLLSTNNNMLITPESITENQDLKYTIANTFFVAAIQFSDPEQIFNYDTYYIPKHVFSTQRPIMFVPIPTMYNTSLSQEQLAVSLFSVGIITLYSRTATNLLRLQIALSNSSRLSLQEREDSFIRIPDFYEAEITYNMKTPLIFTINPLSVVGYFFHKQLIVNAGDSLETTSFIMYSVTSNISPVEYIAYTAVVNTSQIIPIEIVKEQGIIQLTLNLSIPLFNEKFDLHLKFYQGNSIYITYKYSAHISPSTGFISLSSSFSLSQAFRHAIRLAGWSIISPNFISNAKILVDYWIVESLIDFLRYEQIINNTLAKGGTVILMLQPSDKTLWNSVSNTLSQVKLINASDILVKDDTTNFRLRKGEVKEYYSIPAQVASTQSWIPYTTSELEYIIGRGLLFDLSNSSETDVSIVDMFPLHGIYSVAYITTVFTGKLIMISDNLFVRDFNDGINDNLVSKSILLLLNATSYTTTTIQKEGNTYFIKVLTDKLEIQKSSVIILVPSTVIFEINSISKYTDGVVLEISFESETPINSTAYIKIIGISTFTIEIQITKIFDPQIIFIFIIGGGIMGIITLLRKYNTQKICEYCGGKGKNDTCKYCGRQLND